MKSADCVKHDSVREKFGSKHSLIERANLSHFPAALYFLTFVQNLLSTFFQTLPTLSPASGVSLSSVLLELCCLLTANDSPHSKALTLTSSTTAFID